MLLGWAELTAKQLLIKQITFLDTLGAGPAIIITASLH
jgi:hypothetical protein